MIAQGLSKLERVVRKRDFERAFAARCSAADARLVVYVCPNELEYSRLGLAVGRKHGNATARNRIKRLIREAYRLNKAKLPEGLDLVVVPKTGAGLTLSGISESLLHLVPKASSRLKRSKPMPPAPAADESGALRSQVDETENSGAGPELTSLKRLAGCAGNALAQLLILGIRIYQHTFSSIIGSRCRFEPTCSEYFIQALRKRGLVRGILLGSWRILRCNPFGQGGYDPVPGTSKRAARWLRVRAQPGSRGPTLS